MLTVALLTIALGVCIIVVCVLAARWLGEKARADRYANNIGEISAVVTRLVEQGDKQEERIWQLVDKLTTQPALGVKREVGPFTEPEEAWPRDIREALSKYPPELAAPTEAWIRQQRRVRVDWGVIRARVVGGAGGRLEDEMAEESE
jgi:hypothetical protein